MAAQPTEGFVLCLLINVADDYPTRPLDSIEEGHSLRMPGTAAQKSPALSDDMVRAEQRTNVFLPNKTSVFVMVVFREKKSNPEAGIDESQP